MDAAGNLSVAGVFQLARFPNASGLSSEGGIFLAETEASGMPTIGQPGDSGYGTVQSGFLEKSNVNLAEEMHALHILQTWRNGIERAILAINKRSEK